MHSSSLAAGEYVFDVETLLAPISTEQPCGADLEYDPDMLALQQAAAGKPERAVGDTVIAAQEPEWREVASRSEALLRRTKHLGVAVQLARASCNQLGYVGAVQGLALLRGLVERHWDGVYPLLDSDDGSATMRLNTLASFTVADDGIARDFLHAMSYAPLDVSLGRAGLRVRDLMLAFGAAKPENGESAPTGEAVAAALRDLLGKRADLAQSLQDGHAHAQAIKSVLDGRAPTETPDLSALVKLTQAVSNAAGKVQGRAEREGAEAPAVSAAAAGTLAVGALRTRDDCVRALDQVCDWFAKNEPSHPAPYVIQRAKKLVKMNFLEIIRDLAPDGMRQVEDVVGKDASS
jgi:type VI secretion system protein ImpA